MTNKGYFTHRLKDNPLEKKFSEMWDKYETDEYTSSPSNKNGFIFDFLKDADMQVVDDRERKAIATIIQWLGSPIGHHFLDKLHQEKTKFEKNHIIN